jgi:catechol 2,3-dioxygenase-like lactoylglutathione lyase family enzyme
MAWTLDIPAQRVQKLIITVPINDIDWRLEASCRLADSHLSLQPYLSILSNGADTVRVDRVAVLSPQGDPVVIRDEPTVLIIGYRLRLPSGPPLAIPGRLVKRLYADRGEIRRLFLSKDSASIEQVIRLDLKALTYLTDDAYPTAATLSVTPDHGLQIDVGPERHVYIRRVLMDERRENPDLDTYGRVQGYDTIEDYHLEALLNAAIDLEVVEPMTAAWDIKTEVKTDTSRTNEVAMPLHLDAGKIASLDYSIIKHSGTRASR